MINDENRGRDRQSSDYSQQPQKRKRISTGNKSYEKIDYNRSNDPERRPHYTSDRERTERPERPYRPREGSGDYAREGYRENYRRNDDDNRGNTYERRERPSGYERPERPNYDRGGRPGYDRDRSGYERGGSGYERGGSGYERGDRSSGYERRGNGYERGGNGGYERSGNGYERNSERPFRKSFGQGQGQGGGQRPFKKSFNSRDGRSNYSSDRSFKKPFPVMPKPKQPFYRTEEMPPDVPVRLNKFIANTGLCSRREADEYIQAGLITVNGELVTTLGFKVLPTDEIRYNGEKLQQERKVYILLNKPKDYVTSVDDPHAKRTVMELIQGACRERIYPVGRLDRMTTGVLLLTNDGELTKKLTHPVSNIRKIYQVQLDKSLKSEDMHAVSDGVSLDDGFIRVDGVNYISDDDRSIVGVELHSGRNRIVRRVFEHVGYKVVKLDRVYFAGLTKKGLKRGTWRYLDPKEVGFLKMMKA